jgi:hypothetical protein
MRPLPFALLQGDGSSANSAFTLLLLVVLGIGLLIVLFVFLQFANQYLRSELTKAGFRLHQTPVPNENPEEGTPS